MDQKLDPVITRLRQLEDRYEKDTSQMIQTLEKIESALLGTISDKSPGILEDIRNIKVEISTIKATIASYQVELKKIQTAIQLQQVKSTKFLSKGWEKYFWMVAGGGIVIWGLINLFFGKH